MNISFESKGDFKGSLEWLSKITSRDPTTAMQRIGTEGAKSLSSNTPRDTGATASGWNHKIEKKNNVIEIAWTNNAHPNLEVNLATLLDSGYGTRTGGYVPPRPYIQKSMDPVFKTAGDRLFKEMTE